MPDVGHSARHEMHLCKDMHAACSRGDAESDRTSGEAAVQDFQSFVDAGITSFDTAGKATPCTGQHSCVTARLATGENTGAFHADIYGPSEGLIGRFLQSSPSAADVQVLTKFCCFGRDMQFADGKKFVNRVRVAGQE